MSRRGSDRPPGVTLKSPLITHDSSLIARILVVKLAGIGDVLTAFPAMEALRNRYPRAEITAMVTPPTEALVRRSGFVDRTMVLDKYLYDEAGRFLRPRSLTGLIRLARDLRRRAFDAVVFLHHLVMWQGVVKYTLLGIASGAPWRAGLDDGRGLYLNLKAADLGFGGRHEVEHWLEVARLLGAENPTPRIRVTWGPEEETFAAMTWNRLGLGNADRVLALHPGTGTYSPVRRWDAERFAAVAEALASEEGLVPMVVAGPGEEALARRVLELVSARSVLLEAVPSLHSLAAILSRCALFVGNDSGVTHIALASGLPVVAVFGPTNPRAWGPYDPSGERSRVVRAGVACSPCLYRGPSLGLRNGCGDPRCLHEVAPPQVIAAARELLEASAPVPENRRDAQENAPTRAQGHQEGRGA